MLIALAEKCKEPSQIRKKRKTQVQMFNSELSHVNHNYEESAPIGLIITVYTGVRSLDNVITIDYGALPKEFTLSGNVNFQSCIIDGSYSYMIGPLSSPPSLIIL